MELERHSGRHRQWISWIDLHAGDLNWRGFGTGAPLDRVTRVDLIRFDFIFAKSAARRL
jgi:hypothetical protein